MRQNLFTTISILLTCFFTQNAGSASLGIEDLLPKKPNHTSTRYEVNQTFDGHSFHKDNNIWTYNAQFAETFGMPKSGIDLELTGIEAAAYRIENYDYKICGMGGSADRCKAIDRCMLDVYIDETKHPLPWRFPEQKADWEWRYNSSVWLNTKTEGEGALVQPTSEFIPMEGFRRSATLHPFRDQTTKQEAVYFLLSVYGAKDPHSFEKAIEIYGFRRNAIANLSLITFSLWCSPSYEKNKSMRFRLESRETISTPTIKRFHEFILPPQFTQQIRDRFDKHHEIQKAQFRETFKDQPHLQQLFK